MPIGDFQLVQAMLADQYTGMAAGRALVRETAAAYDSGADRRIGPSAAKLFSTEMAGRVADLAVQVHGGTGYMREVPEGYSNAELAPLLCVGIIGYRALKRAALPPGGRLGLYGFGGSAHASGARREGSNPPGGTGVPYTPSAPQKHWLTGVPMGPCR